MNFSLFVVRRVPFLDVGYVEGEFVCFAGVDKLLFAFFLFVS
jgi:hypothetical protein